MRCACLKCREVGPWKSWMRRESHSASAFMLAALKSSGSSSSLTLPEPSRSPTCQPRRKINSKGEEEAKEITRDERGGGREGTRLEYINEPLPVGAACQRSRGEG